MSKFLIPTKNTKQIEKTFFSKLKKYKKLIYLHKQMRPFDFARSAESIWLE